jgi:predicted transcriptional regulator
MTGRGAYTEDSPVRVLWCVFVMDRPTAKEISKVLERPVPNVQGQLKRLFRTGLVRRRRRETNTPHAEPYEYAIRVPEENQ